MHPTDALRYSNPCPAPSGLMQCNVEWYGNYIAEELGIKYDGPMTRKATGEVFSMQFTDVNDTRGTFCGRSLPHVRWRLIDMKLRFRAAGR